MKWRWLEGLDQRRKDLEGRREEKEEGQTWSEVEEGWRREAKKGGQGSARMSACVPFQRPLQRILSTGLELSAVCRSMRKSWGGTGSLR